MFWWSNNDFWAKWRHRAYFVVPRLRSKLPALGRQDRQALASLLKILGWFRYSECSRERFTDIETPQMAQFCWYIFHTVNKQHQTILQESFHQQQWLVKQRTSGIELGRASDLSNKHGFFTNGGLQPQIYCWGHNVSHRSTEITQQALSLELDPMNIGPA
jgi:hypothetical protein